MISSREALAAVITAFLVGILLSLAVRPVARGVGEAQRGTGESVRWRLSSAFGTNLPTLGDNVLYVSERINAGSGGRLRLEVFEPGEIVPAFSIVDAVRDEKLQAGYTWLGYDQGKIASSVLFGAVPFGMEPWEYSAWWYEGGGRELADELYGALGVKAILCGLIGPESAGWFRYELRDPADLRGLKIRFAGLGGKAIQRLGASVTMLPGGEIFQALEKGAIDATEFSLPAVDQRLGLDRVASFNYFPGWHQPFTAFHLVVGQRAWAQLDEAMRSVVETACTSGALRNFSRAEALQGAALSDFAEKGVSTKTLPVGILQELRRVSAEVLAEEAAADDTFARVLASQREFSADYTRWRSLAYPRAR